MAQYISVFNNCLDSSSFCQQAVKTDVYFGWVFGKKRHLENSLWAGWSCDKENKYVFQKGKFWGTEGIK